MAISAGKTATQETGKGHRKQEKDRHNRGEGVGDFGWKSRTLIGSPLTD
jgi:hypothetical protein